MSQPLQNSTKIALDEKIRRYWLVRTSALSEQEIAGIRIVTEGRTGLSAVKKSIEQTIVSTRREEVRDDRREQEDRARDKIGSAGDNFTFLTVRNPSQRQIWKVLTNRTCGTQTMTKLNVKQ